MGWIVPISPFAASIDTSRVFLLALLARKSRFSDREALFGSLLLAVTPATFLLHSWGNLPTTLGLWCTLVTTIYIAVAYRRLDRDLKHYCVLPCRCCKYLSSGVSLFPIDVTVILPTLCAKSQF